MHVLSVNWLSCLFLRFLLGSLALAFLMRCASYLELYAYILYIVYVIDINCLVSLWVPSTSFLRLLFILCCFFMDKSGWNFLAILVEWFLRISSLLGYPQIFIDFFLFWFNFLNMWNINLVSSPVLFALFSSASFFFCWFMVYHFNGFFPPKKA